MKPAEKQKEKQKGRLQAFLKHRGVEVSLILVAMVHAFVVSLLLSPAYDEGKHIINGIAYLENSECCLSDESPFSAAHALFLDADRLHLPPLDRPLNPPRGVLLYSDNPGSSNWIRITSRLSSVLMIGLIALTTSLWLYRFASPRAARAGLFLVAFCPTLLAYASLAGTDIHMAAFSFLSCYAALRFTESPSVKRAVLTGAVLGLTFLTKFSALLFGAALGIFFIFFVVLAAVRTREKRGQLVIRLLLQGGLAVVTALLVLNLGYFFKGTFSPLSAYTFGSESLRSLQEGILGNLPLPLPEGLFKSVDFSRIIAESDMRREMIPGILFGTPYPDGSPWFYLAVLAVKPSAILLALMLFGAVIRIHRRNNPLEGAMLLVYPIFLVSYLSAFDVFNRGIRYLVPLFPLFIATASYAFEWNWKRARVLFAALALFAISTLTNFPNYLAFFNISEYFEDKEMMFIGSNLDWGHMDHLVAEDARAHGATRICPRLAKPHPGRLGLPLGEGMTPQPCTFYLSKTRKMFPTVEPMFRLLKNPPNRVLAGLIEVYEVTIEDDFKNAFLNRWHISEPFDSTDVTPKRLELLGRSLSFTPVKTTFGRVDVEEALGIDSLKNRCVLMRSDDPARGSLFLSATGRLFVFEEKSGRLLLRTRASKELQFYQYKLPWGDAHTVSAVLCGTGDPLSFVAGYLGETNQ